MADFPFKKQVKRHFKDCDKNFTLNLKELVYEESGLYGIIVIDKREAMLATLQCGKITLLGHFRSGIPRVVHSYAETELASEFEARFEPVAHEFFKRTGNAISDDLLPLGDDLNGILIGGSDLSQYCFAQRDYICGELKDKIMAVEDIKYAKKYGIPELLDKLGIPYEWE